MNIYPLERNILVQPLEAEKETTGGILIAETAAEQPTMGKVIAVGNKAVLKPGMTVFYKKWGGTEIKNDKGEEQMIIEEEDILAIIEDYK